MRPSHNTGADTGGGRVARPARSRGLGLRRRVMNLDSFGVAHDRPCGEDCGGHKGDAPSGLVSYGKPRRFVDKPAGETSDESIREGCYGHARELLRGLGTEGRGEACLRHVRGL